MPRALITGIAGQDGSYLAELLLEKGYEVHGLVHTPLAAGLPRLERVRDSVNLHWGDLLDEGSLARVLRRAQPDEVYNLAAATYVPASFDQPALAGEVTGVGVTRMLHATREWTPGARFFQASSGEIFGASDGSRLNEETPLRPTNPYGVAKAYAHGMVRYFRTLQAAGQDGLWSCAGISFNHESPRRGLEFVTRKITHGAAAIKRGLATELLLGNVTAVRDWGFAGEYVEAMWLMLQQDEPDDYVIATGIGHTVQDVADVAFGHLDLDPAEFVREHQDNRRPVDIDTLVGDPSKIRERLGWSARTSFEELIEMMVERDLELIDAGVRPVVSAPSPG